MALKVGDRAPDFALMDATRNRVTLEQYRGEKAVVLAFYLLAFTAG